MNESPALDSNQVYETPEARAVRFTEEEEELERMLLEHHVSGDAADLLIEQLARKHKAEQELNRVFATLSDFNDYEQGVFAPEAEVEATPPISENVTDANDQEQPAAPEDAEGEGDEGKENEAERPLSEEERKELVAELNLITDATIDRERDIIARYEADKADRVRNPKYSEEQYERAQAALTRPKELALAISGKDRLLGDIKIPDIEVMNSYEQKVFEKDPEKREAQKKALPKEERDAYRDAFGRKKDFVQALMDSGVRKGMAYGLYNEFIDHAAALLRFRDGLTAALEAGESVHINKGDPDYDLLKWHGIKDGAWSDIIDQINGQLEQFTTLPPRIEPPRPARVVPLIRPEKKEEGAVSPEPQKEKEEEAAPPKAVPLSGVYEVRDGHVYNSGDTSADAPRLDTDELSPRPSDMRRSGGDRSGTTRPLPTPVIGAKDGVVTYDRELDPDLAREKETLKALMKNKDVVHPPVAAPKVEEEHNPLLSGLYHLVGSIVHTGLAEGEGKPVVKSGETNAPAVDERVSQEVIDGWKEQGIVIPEGTKASELTEVLRKINEAVVTEDSTPPPEEKMPEPKTGETKTESSPVEKFIALQKIYFTESARLIRELGEASARGDDKKVAELEEEREEHIETYEAAIAEYQRSVGAVSGEEREELVLRAAQKAYEDELDAYHVEETPDAPRGTPSYRELQKKAYVEAKFPDVAAVIKKLENPALSWTEFVLTAGTIAAERLHEGEGAYVQDEAEWLMPNGRKLEFGWDTLGGMWYRFHEGPEDLKLAELAKEGEELEEKEDLALFDPKHELDKILKAPTKERAALLAAYKEKLAWQKKGLAEVQAAMEEDIRTDPDMTREEFIKRYMERAAAYAATPKQKEIAERVFVRYTQKRKAVLSTREKYPSDKALFEALFGAEPKGEIEVIEGPMTFYFRLHHADDYALVYSGESLKNEPVITPEMIARVKNVAGCMLARVLIPELNGCVLLEKAEGKPFEGDAKTTYVHEEQHAISQLFDWKKQRSGDNALYLLADAEKAINSADNIEEPKAHDVGPHRKEFEKYKAEEKLEFALTQCFRAFREEAEERAKDEILAYAKDGRSFKEVFAFLTKTKQDGGLYDYLAEPKFDTNELLKNSGLDARAMQKAGEIRTHIFGPEYHALLRDGMAAYDELRSENYREEAIRAILLEEPLGRWRKVVDRLIAQEAGIPDETLKKYEEQFNIRERDLRRIEGFRELTEGQQMLVLKELNNYSVARIRAEALREYRESFNALGKLNDKEQSFIQKGGWWRKVAIGVAQVGKKETYQKAGMALMKRKSIAEREKELAVEMFTGKVDQKEFLAQLVRQAKDGPDAKIVEGRLELQFLRETDIGPTLTPEDAARVEAFNRTAAQFANTPHTWREYNATGEEKAKYAEVEQEYRRACHEVLELKRLKAGDEHASLDVLDLDRKITFNQFFNTNPDAEAMLADIKDQNVWGKWMLETAQTRGGIMALGGAMRTAAGFAASQVVSKASLVAAPIAGLVVGGIRGRKMARTEIQERELLAKIGIVDPNKEARNIVDAEKLTEKIYRLKDEIDAIPYSPNLSPEEREKRTKLIESFDARYEYTRQKIENGLVNFGGEKAIINRYELLKAFGVAAAEIEVNRHWNTELRSRMNSFINFKEEKIGERQKAYVNDRMKRAALWGAGFGFAGAYITDYFHGLYQFEGETKPPLSVSDVKGAPDARVAAGPIAEPEAAPTAIANEAIEAAERDGWMSETVRQMQADAALNKAYVEGAMALLHRKPDVGLSDVELNALQATDNDPVRAAAHAALLKAMEASPGRLSDAEVARIMIEHRVPLSTDEIVTPPHAEVPVNESELHHGGEDVETIVYAAKAGDTLTNIMKERLGIMDGLNPEQQENAIQNFIHRVSPEELRSIGLSDANGIQVGDKIDIGKLNEVFLSKRINGQDLFSHARELSMLKEVPFVGVKETPVSSGQIPPLSQEVVGTLPAAETSLIEKYIGRPISASESNVLHGVRSLASAAESDEELKFMDSAFNHLQLAMREADRPLMLGEMRRILHGHGGLDERIAFPEAKAETASIDAIPFAPAPQTPFVETAPGVPAASLSEEQIANWNNYTETQKLPLASVAAESYLKLDIERLYGVDMFGRPSPAWRSMALRPATEIFGTHGEHVIEPPKGAGDEGSIKILEYAKAQGFTRVHGYEPVRGETVEQFLKRAHILKTLENGPRKIGQ